MIQQISRRALILKPILDIEEGAALFDGKAGFGLFRYH